METTYEMHRVFYDLAMQQVAALREEVDNLQKVAAWHRRMMDFYYAASPPRSGSPAKPAAPLVLAGSLNGKMKHEAAEVALRAIGKPSKVAVIARELKKAGYLPDDSRIAQNSIFTAMTRKADTFEKIDRGLWGLKEWPQNGAAHKTGEESGPEE